MTDTPRVITLGEIVDGWGHGWIECWFEDDEGELEFKTLNEGVWLMGAMLERDGDNGYIDMWAEDSIVQNYNRRYGVRVWSDRPDDETREKVAWDG